MRPRPIPMPCPLKCRIFALPQTSDPRTLLPLCTAFLRGACRWWTLLEEAAVEWQPVESPLPSDSRYRRDLALLAEGEVKQAHVAKEVLEQRQRADAKLRKAALGEGH